LNDCATRLLAELLESDNQRRLNNAPTAPYMPELYELAERDFKLTLDAPGANRNSPLQATTSSVIAYRVFAFEQFSCRQSLTIAGLSAVANLPSRDNL